MILQTGCNSMILDGYKFFRSKVVKTRKVHTCYTCNEEIDIGAEAINSVFRWPSDTMNSVYEHVECKQYRQNRQEARVALGLQNAL